MLGSYKENLLDFQPYLSNLKDWAICTGYLPLNLSNPKPCSVKGHLASQAVRISMVGGCTTTLGKHVTGSDDQICLLTSLRKHGYKPVLTWKESRWRSMEWNRGFWNCSKLLSPSLAWQMFLGAGYTAQCTSPVDSCSVWQPSEKSIAVKVFKLPWL